MIARKNRLLFVLILIAGSALVTAFILNMWAYLAVSRPLNISTGNYTFNLDEGQGLIALNNRLARDGLIKTPRLMRVWSYLVGLPTSLQSGSYEVSAGDRYQDLLRKVAVGIQIEYPFRVLNGDNFADFYHSLTTHPRLKHTLVNKTAADIMAQLGSDYRHPEGLFYADTYHFYADDSDFNVLQAAYNKLERVLQEEWENRQAGLVYKNAYQALILASIIEKETSLDSERSLIASVFHNRLKQGMRLQADPTVIYGMGSEFDGDIRRRDLRSPTPYNTYIIYGLPPTPIALVDRRTIYAALHPSPASYLFFVAKGDGTRSHHFSVTWEEHKKAVERYQLKR